MGVIGARLDGGLQVLREIGRGAVARVYLASDGRRTEAVKLYPEDQRWRAERELRFGSDLHHPNLNAIAGPVEIAGRPGVRMPFVPGRRLGRWAGGAERAAFLQAIDGLLAGLGHLHACGVVHRDVKPENVLVTREGRAVLIDYDLAVSVDDEQDERTLAGTVAYLSPEQARGERALPASDLYAVGVMLYRGLTGEVPFDGSVDQVLQDHRQRQPRAPSGVGSGSDAYDALVARLLDKRPERRPADAEAVRQALGEARSADEDEGWPQRAFPVE